MNYAESMINHTGLAVILLQKRIAELEAENSALRAALEAVEYDVHGICLWCAGEYYSDHNPDCQRQAALGLTPKPGE